MKNYILPIALLAVFSLGACSSIEEEAAPKGKGPSAAKVTTVPIERDSLFEERRFMGDVTNAESTVLAAGGSGEVIRVTVAEGDQVKRGQMLAQLDDSILRARLAELQAGLSQSDAQLEQAKRDADRLKNLSGQGYFPSAEVEQVTTRKTTLEAAKQGQDAGIRRLREEIAQMRITAPFDGVVSKRHIAPGQWLSVGQPAIELASEGVQEVHVRVPGTLLDVLSETTEVVVSRGEYEVKGSIAGVAGAVDVRSRTALLRVVPEAAPEWLREGLAVDALLRIERVNEGVVVPIDAVVYSVSGARVFLEKEGKAEPVDVTVVAQNSDEVLVSSERLEVGQKVVTRGNERLRPGQDLQVMQ